MSLKVRPFLVAWFAVLGGSALWLTALSMHEGREFNKVAYSPLWTGEIDLATTGSVRASINTSYPCGHAHWIYLVPVGHELDSQFVDDYGMVVCTLKASEPVAEVLEIPFQWTTRWHEEQEITVLGGEWHPQTYSEIAVELKFVKHDDRVADGPYRIEVWAGVCGLEALWGMFLGLCALLAGLMSLGCGLFALKRVSLTDSSAALSDETALPSAQ